MSELGIRSLFTLRSAGLVWLPMALVAVIHYATPAHPHWVHDVARRLYYVPIILAGAIGGLRAGLFAAALTLAVYAPHAWLPYLGPDPATSSEKALEMLFYVLLGGLSGFLADRERGKRAQQAELNEKLRRTLDEMQAKDVQLDRAARLHSLGRVTAGLAHEIRNPLHAMRGTAEVLLDFVPAGAAEQKLGRGLISEIDRLSGLLRHFLEFAGRTPPKLEILDLAQLARHVADLVRAKASQQSTRVEVEAGSQLPVLADWDQIVQVALSICINALQALGSGGHLRLSTVQLRRHGQDLRGLRIVNDGPPIGDELLERIFDPFVSTRDEGTGLGLATAWRIIESHGGRIEGENLPDAAGVAFQVLLPESAESRIEPDPGPTGPEPHSGEG